MKGTKYLVCLHRDGYVSNRRPIYKVGTVKELTKYFSYTLECGKSWERERGNKKISLNPRGIDSLIKNVNNAKRNSSRNGYSGEWLELVKEVDENFVLES